MNLEQVETPAYVIDLGKLMRNADALASVRRRTDCRILLALKGFSMFSVFPLLRDRLQGVCASSLYEARLGRETFGGEVHVFAPAYRPEDMPDLLAYADTMVFNSFDQRDRFRPDRRHAPRPVRFGLRVNPECSTCDHPLYDACAPGSRLGIRREQFDGRSLEGVSGLHFHTLCEQNADALEVTLQAFEQKFGAFLTNMEWVNFGGGHHITRPDYDVDLLCRLIERTRDRYGVTVYIEPGEAAALDAGVLVCRVLDRVQADMDILILDTSAEAHMPDVLAMPYRPRVTGAGHPGEKAYTCRLAGMTCLAGDVIGDYSFDRPPEIGDRIVFEDMAHYTMVKNTTFNGIPLPSIAVSDPDSGEISVIRRFTYDDFKSRLS